MSKFRRVIAPEVAEGAPETWSNCLVAGNTVYIAGLTARDPVGDATIGADDETQARIIFGKMKALLEAAGGDMSDVIKMTVYVTDIRRRKQVWQARREFFSGDFPASTLMKVSKMADPAITVEIEAIAVLGPV